MSFIFFVARKFILSKKDSRLISFISAFSIGGIALGVAALIITISILDGFDSTLTNKITGFNSHINIISYKDQLPVIEDNLQIINETLGKYKSEVIPYISKIAILSKGGRKEGVSIKGIPPAYKNEYIKSSIIEGEYDISSDSVNNIVIGRKLANRLLVKTGDLVTLFGLKGNYFTNGSIKPLIGQFRISAIFESGMAEYDDLYAFTDIATTQKIFYDQNEINGYDIRINDINVIDSLTKALSEKLKYPYYVTNIFQTHRNIFTWINLQKQLIPVILFLITIVAVFNIIGTLLILILEKTNAIGILRSLGAKKIQLAALFTLQGLFLAVNGIIIGNIIAGVLLSIQEKFKVISLPSSVYFVSSVPVDLSPGNFLLVSVITIILSFMTSLIPGLFVSRIQPVISLRFR